MFNGDRLRVARQRRAMTKKSLAEALNVTPRAITGWENDEYPPESDSLRKIERVLGFSRTFFALEDTAKTPSDAVSFRSLSSKTAKQRDAALAMCDIAKDISAWIEKRFDLPEPNIPDLRGESADVAASLLRHEWGLGHKPIKNVLNILEAKGVRVFSLAENCREIDACSFWSDNTPFILLKTDVSSERLRFDMAHELGHLVLHKHAAPLGREAENEANQFASSFLMPEESLRQHRVRNWSMKILLEKKTIWGVSVSAFAYRLHKIGYMSDWHFKSLNIEFQRRGYKTREPNAISYEQSRVLEAVLGRMRDIGMPVSYMANQMGLPESEVKGLLYGLAKVSFDGKGENFVTKDNRASLKIVK